MTFDRPSVNEITPSPIPPVSADFAYGRRAVDTSMVVAPDVSWIEPELLKDAIGVLDVLPYPALWIAKDHAIVWANRAAVREYGSTNGPCYLLYHGYESPCPFHGEACPKIAAESSGHAASVVHAHSTPKGTALYQISAIPLRGGGVLEFHIPLQDVIAEDLLTGLLGHYATEQVMRSAFELLRRLQRPVALLMLDLDHFKRVNDRYGHLAGDAVLAAVGATLRAGVRKVDVTGRWGGEEFLIMLPGVGRDGAVEKSRRLLEAIRELRIPHHGHILDITASIGIWAGSPETPFETALERADQAMYHAKSNGRNRLEVYGEVD